jgi:hypothetical protein
MVWKDAVMELQPSVRATDSDREGVAERLRHATSEGRLTGDELEERLETLFAARTYGELDALVADLPAAGSRARPGLRMRWWVGAVGAATLVLGVLGALALVARRSEAAAVLGRRVRHLSLPGPFADPHQGFVLAASAGAALVMLVVCAAGVWALMRSKSTQAL